jgi:hypothetical protein
MSSPDTNTKAKREHDEAQKKMAADRAQKRQDYNRKVRKDKVNE